MEVRDAVEADAEALADMTDGPTDVVRNLIHDRTVRVAESGDDVVGVVSFDARPDSVYVTQLAGSASAVERLLEEPVRFARREGMPVEVLVSESDEVAQDAIANAGFTRAGTGPRFDGAETILYRRPSSEPE